MEFGYFTLSDNHYENNPRDANKFVSDITAEALYADQLGMHSAWIGEHHFNSLGVLSCPELVLAYIAARTKHIRLAPAVNVTPLHHPIRVAEQWATLDLLSGGRVDFASGRGYDSREYAPFKVDFADNQSIFEEGMEVIQKLWSRRGPHLAPRQALSVRRRAHHAEADPEAAAGLHRLVLQALDRARRAARLRPDRRAVRRRHELRRLEAGRRPLQRDLHQARQQAGPADVQLLHAFLRQPGSRRTAQRARQIRYYKECVIPAFPSDPKTAPPSYRYFVDMVERLHKVKPEDLTENSVLLGNAARITEVAEEGRGRGLLRGDPLLQRRHEAARPGEGRDGPLHARGGAEFRGQAQAAPSGVVSLTPHTH